MIALLNIALAIPLIFIYIQDNRDRAVHVFWFVITAALSISIFILNEIQMKDLILNLAFGSVLVILLFVYISLKEQKWTNIFKTHFGLGDFVFLLAVAPLFSLRNYVLFIVSGMFFSALVHIIRYGKEVDKSIPLAGYLGVYVIGLKTTEVFVAQFNFYADLV